MGTGFLWVLVLMAFVMGFLCVVRQQRVLGYMLLIVGLGLSLYVSRLVAS